MMRITQKRKLRKYQSQSTVLPQQRKELFNQQLDRMMIMEMKVMRNPRRLSSRQENNSKMMMDSSTLILRRNKKKIFTMDEVDIEVVDTTEDNIM